MPTVETLKQQIAAIESTVTPDMPKLEAYDALAKAYSLSSDLVVALEGSVTTDPNPLPSVATAALQQELYTAEGLVLERTAERDLLKSKLAEFYKFYVDVGTVFSGD